MLVTSLRKLAEQDHLRIKEGQYANRIMQGTLTLHEYKILILANQHFHVSVQKAIKPFLSHLTEYQFIKRNKINHLKYDLVELNLTSRSYQFNSKLSVESFWQALGAAYVVEGTAIGGAIIKKKLLTNSNITNNVTSINFYGCYKTELSALWKSFISFLEISGNEATELQIQETINKAKETFMFYEAVIEESKKNLDMLELAL